MALPRSAKQKSALRKAQLASARARRGKGKAKPVGKRRRKAIPPPKKIRRRAATAKTSAYNKAKVKSRSGGLSRRKKIAVGAAGAAVAVGAGAYAYKNRENLIVQPLAQRRFVKIAEREKGRKLTRREKIAIKNREKRQHKSRSVDAARAYADARSLAIDAYRRGKTVNPNSANYIFKGLDMGHIDDGVKRNGKYGTDSGRFMFELYRKDVNARAERRFNRIKGKKSGFGYNSGKQKRVSHKGRVTKLKW